MNAKKLGLCLILGLLLSWAVACGPGRQRIQPAPSGDASAAVEVPALPDAGTPAPDSFSPAPDVVEPLPDAGDGEAGAPDGGVGEPPSPDAGLPEGDSTDRASCVAKTCAEEGKNCGQIADGCGGSLECGSCTSPEKCGAGGQANVCGVAPPAPSRFFLYDEATHTFIAPLGATLDLKAYARYSMLNIAYRPQVGNVGSVRFKYDSRPQRIESGAPYTVFLGGADRRGDMTTGEHVIQSWVYRRKDGSGTVEERGYLKLEILNGGTPTPPKKDGWRFPSDRTKTPSPPKFSQTKKISQTIIINKPGTYDYKGVLHLWTGKGKCSQAEGQPPILHIKSDNVTLLNFAYKDAPDGIHITGKNVVVDGATGWACEDVLTVKYGSYNVTIKNSFFIGNPNTKERDKLVQLNDGSKVNFYYNIFRDSPRMIRFKSGAQLSIANNRFYNFQQAIKGDTDKYGSLKGDRPTNVAGEKNYFRSGNQAYYAEGTIKITSTKDSFSSVREKGYTRDGAKITYK